MAALQQKALGRPRIFEEQKVLDIVLELFWRHGYEGTSMADITKATGLHKGSLYQAFGDKKSLFIRVLENYLNRTYNGFSSAIAEVESPREKLRALLNRMVGFATTDTACSSGCMAVNTLVEMGPHDAEVQAILEKNFTRQLDTMCDIITEGQKRGELKTEYSPRQLSLLAGTMMGGLGAALKGIMSEDQAREVVHVFLDLLD